MHGTILGLLEFFEIIYKMRMNKGVYSVTGQDVLSDEQMFFVPSLLSPFVSGAHPSVQYWQQIDPKYVYLRNECNILIICSQALLYP